MNSDGTNLFGTVTVRTCQTPSPNHCLRSTPLKARLKKVGENMLKIVIMVNLIVLRGLLVT